MATYHVQFTNSQSTKVDAGAIMVTEGWTNFYDANRIALSCAPSTILYYKVVD